MRGKEQSRQEPRGSCADSWLRIIISNPYAYDGCNRSVDRTALADGFCFSVYVPRKLFDPRAGNHREMDLKTIALDLVPAVAERREFKWGTNDGLCGESADPDAVNES